MTKTLNTFRLTALLAVLASQSAFANTLTYDGFKWGSVTTAVSTSAPLDAPVTATPSTGGFNVHIDSGSSFLAWCVDVWQWLGGSNYTYQSSPVGLALDAGKVTLNQAKVDNLNRIASEAYTSINNATTSAAFQAAIWEIAFENSGTYSLASGAFAMTSPSAVTTQAQTWLNNLGNYSPASYSVSVWSSPSQQDALVFARVPEPATYTMLLAGLGLMTYTARRRKTARI